jgi:hypothetical protein
MNEVYSQEQQLLLHREAMTVQNENKVKDDIKDQLK